MKPRKLSDIWDAEVYYDGLRWSSERPFEEYNDDELNNLRRDLSETISSLSKWLNRRLIPSKRARIKTIRRKLVDFRWHVVQEFQMRQQDRKHYERLENMLEPQPRKADSPPPPPYGLHEPLKGSNFFRSISRVFAPRPKSKRVS